MRCQSQAVVSIDWNMDQSPCVEGNQQVPLQCTEAEPAVRPVRRDNRKDIRRGRAVAGLPQGEETPVGFSFLNPNVCKSFVPTFTFLGPKDFYADSLLRSFICLFKTTT